MLALAIVSPAFGADEQETPTPVGLQYGVRLGAKYTDNYLRSVTDEVDSTLGIVGFEVGGDHKGRRLEFSAYGDVEYQQPVENSLEADLLGRMAATGSYQFVPETLALTAAGLFTQVRPDLTRPDSVNNREDVFSYAVGPVARFRLGDYLGARVEARYTSSDYSLRPLDNESAGAEVIVGHEGARESYWGIGAGYYDVSYKEKIDPSAVRYTRQQVLARYNAVGTRTTIRVDAGYERIEGDEGKASGPLIRATLTRRLTPALSAYLNYTSEFPVSGTATSAPPGTPVPGDESVLTAAPRRTRFGTVGLSFDRPRTQANLVYFYSVEDGVLATPGKRDYQGLRGTLSRYFTPNSIGTIYADRSKDELRGLSPEPIDSTKTSYGGDFEVLFGRKLGVTLYVQYNDVTSTLAIDQYDELTAGLFVRYGRVDSRAVQGGATAPIGR